MKALLKEIKQLRLEMKKVAPDKDLTDPRVVVVSQRLDTLINKFYFYQKNAGHTKGIA